MENKKQIVFIHGGDAFRDNSKLYEMLKGRNFSPYEDKKGWRENIIDSVLETHECHSLKMPNPYWADYIAWKIWFEKMVPFLRDGAVLSGHSLGGGFLLRFLTEEKLPVSVAQVHLIAPVVIAGLEDTSGFTLDLSKWKEFASKITELHLWHSSDDPYVPMEHSERFAKVCPEAKLHTFTDRGHFLQEYFPELLAEIQRV